MSKLKRRVNELGRSARDEMTREDAAPVFAAIALAKNSSRYWRENHGEWRQAVVDALPEADSTVIRGKNEKSSKGACDCKKLVKIKVIEHPDGSTTTVRIYECGCPGGSGGGRWEL
jgi:hypothetical protein